MLLLIRHANIAKFVYSNILCIASKDNESLLGTLIKDSGSEVQWFKYNKIFAFPDKFRTSFSTVIKMLFQVMISDNDVVNHIITSRVFF